ncbi:unnamed protein product [Boreogadus saida]
MILTEAPYLTYTVTFTSSDQFDITRPEEGGNHWFILQPSVLESTPQRSQSVVGSQCGRQQSGKNPPSVSVLP